MKPCVLVLAGLVLLTTAAAGDEKDKAIKQELEKLQGQWKQVSSERQGKEMPTQMGTLVTIDGKKWTAASGPATKKTELTFTLDPAQNPKALDLIRKGADGKETTGKAIYKIDKDTLTVCYHLIPGGNEKEKERPKEFKSTEDLVINVFKRVEK